MLCRVVGVGVCVRTKSGRNAANARLAVGRVDDTSGRLGEVYDVAFPSLCGAIPAQRFGPPNTISWRRILVDDGMLATRDAANLYLECHPRLARGSARVYTGGVDF